MKKYRLLLLSFVFFGTLLGSFHHHNKVLVDDDCPICIVQNNLGNSADVVVTPLSNVIFSEYLVISHFQKSYIFQTYLEKLSRAPPKFS